MQVNGISSRNYNPNFGNGSLVFVNGSKEAANWARKTIEKSVGCGALEELDGLLGKRIEASCWDELNKRGQQVRKLLIGISDNFTGNWEKIGKLSFPTLDRPCKSRVVQDCLKKNMWTRDLV